MRRYLINIGIPIAIVMAIALVRCASAHDWYPPECCHGEEHQGDCRAVPREDLEEQADGCWKYLPTGNLFCKYQIHPSQDSHWHVCIGNKSWDKGKSYCVFIQQGS